MADIDKILADDKELVIEDDKKFTRRSFFFELISVISILSMIFPLVVMDIFLQIYQYIYFTIHEIPKVPRSKYIIMDRWKLPKLTLVQKFSCGYCEYANGVISWAKDVAGQTEIYSCAIKHWHPAYGQEEHQKRFYSYKKFE